MTHTLPGSKSLSSGYHSLLAPTHTVWETVKKNNKFFGEKIAKKKKIIIVMLLLSVSTKWSRNIIFYVLTVKIQHLSKTIFLFYNYLPLEFNNTGN